MAKNFCGSTALNVLCEQYREDNPIDLVQLLIDGDIDVNAKDFDGWTALYCMCQFYYTQRILLAHLRVRLLIDKGAEDIVDGLTAPNRHCPAVD